MPLASVTCLGVGDGWPCADRNHSSFLYRVKGSTFLIDCGDGVSRSYKAGGLSYDQIDKIFLSHLHCDHLGGFFMLMQGFWLEQRRKALSVHLPADGIAPIRQLLDAACIFEELHSFRLDYTALSAKETVAFGDARVTPYVSTHLDTLRVAFQSRYPQSFEAFSFLIESEGCRIAHSADIGGPEDLLPLLEKPLDLLVCELAHFEPQSLFETLKGARIAQLVFVHVARPYWEKLPEMQRKAEEALPGLSIKFARDGARYDVPRPA